MVDVSKGRQDRRDENLIYDLWVNDPARSEIWVLRRALEINNSIGGPVTIPLPSAEPYQRGG